KDIKKGSFIGIYIDDKIELISAIIGVLKAGCVFVVLDTALPVKRIENMLKLTHTQALLTDHRNQTTLFASGSTDKKDICSLIIDETMYQTYDSEFESAKTGRIEYTPGDKIYVYFTSGSSGIPKAIIGKNKSLLQFIQWEIETFNVDETYRVSQFTAPGFDAFLRDVFVPLCAGGTVCIPESVELIINPVECIRWIDNNRINLIHCVPGVFRVFNSESIVPGNFEALKYVLLSGEAINPNQLNNWYDTFGERIQLVNFYGPSETTMIKTYYFIRKADTRKKRIPIGKPMIGAQVFILDSAMKPCGKRITGEVYIRTPFGTYGYYNDQEANKKRFIPNPITNDATDLFYRTGDLGRLLPDGNVDLLGRIDRQVKIRGIRVELGDIENKLLLFPGIRSVVVIHRERKDDTLYLCAYYEAAEELQANSLINFLAQWLQEALIPSFFIRLEHIPLTPN
ncbi:MAG: amino acid adenylation domain-containing protein, partial [bacterium]|nr:amino acid adenylation domain-containing protein [bacterium]